MKSGGYIYIALTGMKNDCHDAAPEAGALVDSGDWTTYTTRVWGERVRGRAGTAGWGQRGVGGAGWVWGGAGGGKENAGAARETVEAGGGRRLELYKDFTPSYSKDKKNGEEHRGVRKTVNGRIGADALRFFMLI